MAAAAPTRTRPTAPKSAQKQARKAEVAEPLPLHVPDGLADDDPWWDHELYRPDIARLMQCTENNLAQRIYWARRKNREPVAPPMAVRGRVTYCTRRAYHEWWLTWQAKRAAELGAAGRSQLVTLLRHSLPAGEYKQLLAQLATVDRMRQQAADLLAYAEQVETSTLAPYRP